MKKMRKKGRSRILSGVLAICMVISLMPTVSAAATTAYTDVSSGDWYYDSVKYVSEHKYFEGTGGGAFSPNAPMTRAMFVTVLSRLENVTAGDNISPFDDVASGAWYAGEVAWAVDKKLANGTGNGAFSPEKSVTRQDMAAFMSRYISYYTANHDVTLKNAGTAKSFTDESSIASYAKDAVALCTSYGLIDGYPDGSFAPSDTASRAQVATVIYRLALLLEGGNGGETEAVSAGGSGGGHTSSVSEQTAATAADFEAAAEASKRNVTATIEDTNYLTVNDDVTIDNSTASVLTLNIGKANLGKLTINAGNATKIYINTGEDKAASLSSLVINAPYAHVINNVNVNGTVDVQAVAKGTFENNAKTSNIIISGTGAVADTQNPAAQLVVNTDKEVIVKGNTASISVIADGAKLTVAPAKKDVAPKIESTASDVALTVETDNAVTIEGTVKSIEAKTEKPELKVEGTVESIKTSEKVSELKVEGTGSVSTMETGKADVKVAEEAKLSVETVKASGGKIEAPANTISTVKVEKNATVELKAPVETVAAAEGAILTLDKEAKVKTLEAEGSLTLSGNGEVTSVDVQSADAEISVNSENLTVTQVTASEANAESVTLKGLDEVKVQAKAAKPTVKADAPTSANGNGSLVISNASGALEYKELLAKGWSEQAVENASASIQVASGTYQVRVKATATSLASEPVTVTIPKAVGVNKAEIQGTAYIGKTLTAVANADATDTLHYEWKAGETVIGTDSKTLTLSDNMTVRDTKDTVNIIGKSITVRIYNYKGSVTGVTETNESTTSAATAAVTVDKSTLEKLLAKSSEIQNGVTVKDNNTAANAVAEGVIFVTTSEKTALDNAITAATAENKPEASSSAVSAQETALRTANDNFIKAKKTGTRTDADVFKADLTALLETAPAAASNDASSTIKINDDAKKVAPGVQWVTEADAKAYSDVKTAAEKARDNASATKEELSTAITNLNSAITTYIKAIQKGAALDDSALLAAINAAEINKASVEISTNNGNDVIPSKNWVSQDAMTAYETAISNARTEAAKKETQSVYDAALEDLTGTDGATATFNAAKQAGTKDVVAPTVTDITATLDGEKATISFTTNEAGSYKVGNAEEGTPIAAGTVSFKVDYTAADKTAKKSILVKVYDNEGNMTEFAVTPSSKVVQLIKADGTVSDTAYETLSAAIAAAEAGDTVKLVKNVQVTLNDTGADYNGCDKTLHFEKNDITLDLNGKTLTTVSNKGGSYNVLNILATGWTIKDGSIIVKRADGTADSYALAVECENGTLTLDNVSLSGGIAAYDTVTVTMKDTNMGTTAVAATNYYCAYAEEGAKFIIDGGTYTSNGSKAVFFAAGADDEEGPLSSIEVLDGDIKGTIFNCNGNVPGTISITGGTFNVDPTAYLAKGYKAVKSSDNVWTVTAFEQDDDGSYLIENAADLAAFRDAVNAGDDFAGKKITLVSDIDLSGMESWEPIGYSASGKNADTNAKPFSGEFDGTGHSITGLKIRSDAKCLGLFGFVKSTVNIHDFSITVDIDTKTDNAENCNIGAVVGAAHGDTQLTLKNITVNGTIKGFEKVGGLVGQAPQYNSPSAGYTPSILIENCENYANVTGERAAGIISSGLNARGTATFKNCINYGTITDGAQKNGYIAGIVGQVNAPGLGVTFVTNVTFDAYKEAYEQNSFLTVSGCLNRGVLVPSEDGTAYSLLNTSYSYMDGKNGSSKVKDQRTLVFPVYMLSEYAENAPYVAEDGTSYGVDWKTADSEHKWLQGYAYDTDNSYDVMLNDGTKFTQTQFNVEGTDDVLYKNLTVNSAHPYAEISGITLLNDLTWSRSYLVAGSGKDIIVDLNGKTLTADATLFTKNSVAIKFVNGTIAMGDSCNVLVTGCSNVTFENVKLDAPDKTILQLDGTGGPVMGSSTFGSGVNGKIEIINANATSVTFNGTTFNWNDEGGTMGTYTIGDGVVTKDTQE